MTDPNYTHIVFLLDESASMVSRGQEPPSGFNQFLEEQRALPTGKCFLCLARFNSTVRVQEGLIGNFPPIPPMGAKELGAWRPAGMTILRDAVAHIIENTGMFLSIMPEEARPGNVLFVILTDGEDTASKQYSQEQVENLIKNQEQTYNWHFLYLGLGLDQWTHERQAAGIGISLKHTLTVDDSAIGLKHAYDVVSRAAVSLRTTGNMVK